MLLNLDKAITRAQDSFVKRSSRHLTSLRNPPHNNEEVDDKKLNADVDQSDSDASNSSKKSYVSVVSSKTRNIEKSNSFNKKNELETEEERRIALQRQQQKNLVKNMSIRQSKRLSGEHSNFFEYENIKNANIVQQNKKIKIDSEDIETLEKLDSKKMVNKEINNIMRNNNRIQNIRVNNYKKIGNTMVTKNVNKNNKNFEKNNVNNNNNIMKFNNNNNSRRDKEEDELSQSSGESEGSDAEKRFFKNRLLIYDDIIIE
jgi:hypothetical protein